MKDARVYIGTSTKGPARKKTGWYLYILESDAGGRTWTKEGRKEMEDVCENDLAVAALAEALSRFREPAHIVVFTTCQHILNTCRNGWLPKWQQAGWKNARGKPVNHAEEWEKILEALQESAVEFREDRHPYSSWMATEFKTKERG